MILAVSILLTAGVLAFVMLVRPQDVPEDVPESPVQHLEDRKAVIYDNLRDLNFEYRLGKLSDADYNKTKLTLQNELAHVLAEIDRVGRGVVVEKKAPAAKPPLPDGRGPVLCPSCGAKLDKPMKFCGECGKAMPEVRA